MSRRDWNRIAREATSVQRVPGHPGWWEITDKTGIKRQVHQTRILTYTDDVAERNETLKILQSKRDGRQVRNRVEIDGTLEPVRNVEVAPTTRTRG